MSAPAQGGAAPPPPGPLRPFHFPDVVRRRLPNGLELVVCEVRSFPVVTCELVLSAGSLTEPAERGGVASLTSALLESGAGGRSAAEIAERVDALGLSLDSGINWDVTQVGFTALRARTGDGLALLADLVRSPEFPQPEVERIRAQRLTALVQNRADPESLAVEVANRYVFAPGSPFTRPMGGLAGTVSRIGRDDVAAFHAERYRPGGSALVVAGDLSASEAVELAERALGDWQGAVAPPPRPEVRPASDSLRFVVAHRAGSVQSALRVQHLGLERASDDYFAVVVMNAILGGLFTSRINLNLRERLGYTYGASSSFTMRRVPGIFAVATAVQSETTAHAASEILRDMRRMREEPVSAAELDDARNYLALTFPLGLQTTDGVAGKLVTSATFGLPDDYWDRYRDRIMAVAAEDVLQAAQKYLRPDSATVVVAGDADVVRPALEALGEGEVLVIDPAAELG